jgi:ADP-ribosylglycohydrolase
MAGRILGGLYGLLIGDALGVPYEFKSPGALPPWDKIEMSPPVGFDRTYGLPDGTWSDDGAQALCLLDSLVECEGWNVHDFGQRLVAWYDEGYMAVGKHVFDVGIASAGAIRKLRDGVAATESGGTSDSSNGNGSLMRSLPVALWALRHNLEDAEVIRIAREQSVVTHAHPRSQLCCALYCLWAARIGRGEDVEASWDSSVQVLHPVWMQPNDTNWTREFCPRRRRPAQATSWTACARRGRRCGKVISKAWPSVPSRSATTPIPQPVSQQEFRAYAGAQKLFRRVDGSAAGEGDGGASTCGAA